MTLSIARPGEPGNPPQVLPSDCDTSVGNNDGAKLNYLVDCGDGPDEMEPTDGPCDWWGVPAQPTSTAARARADDR